MRYTNFFVPTLKEVPAEAEIVSHKLMLRSGMIRKIAAGVYSILPLGVRVIRKIETIVREEMDNAGALETIMPSVQPADLWRESGRWEQYGPELLRINDRHGREFCYGPTHEEVITELVRNDIKSYRSLPINLYQIQTKFRDEIRPRFGVMRAREFSMKDAYSFDADQEGADKSYALMKQAYENIFNKLDLKFRVVEADTGQIGGAFSHEFMVLADSGEDTIAFCTKCQYASNVEKVESAAPVEGDDPVELAPIEKVSTPGQKTIEEVSKFLDRSGADFIKTLIYKTDLEDGEFIMVLCRGDHDVNEVKLTRAIGANEIRLAEPDEVAKLTGAPVGFAGPVGMENITIVADNYMKTIRNGVTGANEKDYHLTNVNPSRDFPTANYADIKQAVAGDRCPRCDDGALDLARGIEVGHIFQLGVKYSEAMNATFLDNNGVSKPMIMGCYGLGVARTAAAAIEQNHDENGIIWPLAIAPFKVVVLPLNTEDGEVSSTAGKIYDELNAKGYEPIIDDRNARPGVKFSDADLIGIPLQVVVGKKGLSNGTVEIKNRRTGVKESVPVDQAVATIDDTLASN